MCVTEPPCPLFHPEKTEILPLHPALPPLSVCTPPLAPSASTRLWSAPAATLERWQSEERERGRERDDSSSTSVEKERQTERERERERERGGEKKVLFWWWRFWVNRLCLASIWTVDALRRHLPWLAQMLTCNQWWNTTKYIYSSTVLRYLYFTGVFPFHATLYFYSTSPGKYCTFNSTTFIW